MKRSVLILLTFVLAAGVAFAQPKHANNPKREKWFRELCEFKHQFLAKEMELTPDQQAKFFPLYDAMQNEIFTIHKGTRQMEKNLSAEKNPSDVEYEKMAEALIEVKIKEGEIQKRHLQKMKGIITSKQIYKLQVAEKKFSRMLSREHNKHVKKQH